jgi:histidinol-phosphate aminotransferase
MLFVDRGAQAAAGRALADRALLDRARDDNRTARDLLCRGLAELGIGYFPPTANFVLIRLPDMAARLRELPLVRDVSDIGLPDHFRISVGRRNEVVTFLEELNDAVRLTGSPR